MEINTHNKEDLSKNMVLNLDYTFWFASSNKLALPFIYLSYNKISYYNHMNDNDNNNVNNNDNNIILPIILTKFLSNNDINDEPYIDDID
jgi:hypothetical protein